MAELYLSDNQLTGNIENIVENLPNLTILEAHVNDLTISTDLRFPPSLSWLNLAGNHLEGSRLTSNISQLSHLKRLGLSEMNLEGTIPTELGMISDLERLDLHSNPELSGRFPWNSIMNATALRFLRIDSCDLTGQLPSDIGRFSSLEILDVGSNFLEGSIPESIGDMTSLSVLVARQNFLTGTLPSTIGLLTSMSTLVLTWNELEGTLPTEMVNLTSLAILALEENDFTGGDLEFLCGRGEDEEFINAVATVDSSANINCSCCQNG